MYLPISEVFVFLNAEPSSRVAKEEKIFCLSENMKTSIKSNRGKSDQEIEENVEILKNWYKKQEHLPQNYSDHAMSELLFHCKYRMEKAKKKLDAFYSIPHLFPEYYQDRSVLCPRIQECLDKTIFVYLPKLSEKFERIAVMKEIQPNSDFLARMIIILMMCDLRVDNEMSNCDSIIMDFENTNMAIVLSVNPMLLYKFFMILEKAYMPNIGTIHLLNFPAFGINLFNTVKKFLRKKYQDKIHMHDNYKNLHTFFSKQILPSDYEGDEKSLREIQKDWIAALKEKDSWFQDKEKRFSNESLRIGPVLENDILGIQGTFKQLNVD